MKMDESLNVDSWRCCLQGNSASTSTTGQERLVPKICWRWASAIGLEYQQHTQLAVYVSRNLNAMIIRELVVIAVGCWPLSTAVFNVGVVCLNGGSASIASERCAGVGNNAAPAWALHG